MDPEGRKTRNKPGRSLFVPGGNRNLSKVCHSDPERSEGEESAFVRHGSELQILRSAQDDTHSLSGKDSKIVGTNSTSPLESAKPQKNELETNSKRTAKAAEICAVMLRIRPDAFLPSLQGTTGDEESRSDIENIQGQIPRFARNDSLHQVFTETIQPLPYGLRQITKSAKDVKIVGTNSTSLLESIKPQKNELETNSKRTQI